MWKIELVLQVEVYSKQNQFGTNCNWTGETNKDKSEKTPPISHASQVGAVRSSTKCVQNYFTASKLLFLMLYGAQIKFSKKLQMYTFHIKKTRSWLVSSFLRSIHLLFSFSLKTEMITPKSAGTIARACPGILKFWSKNRCSAFKNYSVDLKPSPFDQKYYFW